MEAAGANDAIPFGIASEQALFEANNVEKDSVVIFKQFDDKRNDLTEDITVASVNEFVAANQLPLLVEFTQDVRLALTNANPDSCLNLWLLRLCMR